ncbi:hypothetical protein [Georgenia sp. AZ-5]|uniref:hypothetical protein n=1 Tax=Georgenia sp. AZ-5 TaxID=3367526 RepID=UPI003755120D
MTAPNPPAEYAAAIERTAVREHITVAQAAAEQHRLVDAIQQILGSDEIFTEDYGQERSLATGAFGSGGRPVATAKVESALARYFGTGDAVLVPGAGTGAIRGVLSSVPPRGRVVVHSALPYKTTAAALERMALETVPVDFNDLGAVRSAVQHGLVDALYVQHVPHQLGDVYELADVIAVGRESGGDGLLVLVDDNYAAMRSPRIGVQCGADGSALSLFKLLARSNIGCVLGSGRVTSAVRRDLSSAGSQVQGADAMDALRSLVYAPVALALQNAVVVEAAAEINRLAGAGQLPYVRCAIPSQLAMRAIGLVFDAPIAEPFLRSAWRNGSPSRSVGEEARYDVVPLFTYLAGTFLKSAPGIERYVVRINPLRGGTETIVRVLEAALEDAKLRADAAAASV